MGLNDSRFSGSKWELEMAVRPESLPDEHVTVVGRLLFGNALFYLALSHQGVGVLDSYYGAFCGGPGPCASTYPQYGTKVLTPGKWSVIKLSIVPASTAGQPHRIIVAIDGVVTVERAAPAVFAPTPNNPEAAPRLDVGLVLMTGDPKERRVLIDDVALDVTP